MKTLIEIYDIIIIDLKIKYNTFLISRVEKVIAKLEKQMKRKEELYGEN